MTTENTEGRGRPTCIHVDICDTCHADAKASTYDPSIARCYECARYACTCWLENCRVEGEARMRYFCIDGVPGSCAR